MRTHNSKNFVLSDKGLDVRVWHVKISSMPSRSSTSYDCESNCRRLAAGAGFARKPTGFSIIELLVVVGILALLIAFLLPTLNTARQQVVTVNCLSRMRQLGAAFTMYANDNRGWMASCDTCGPINPELFVDPSGQQTNISWTGWVDGGGSSQALSNGTLWTYLTRGTRVAKTNDPAIAVYHCPNDLNPYRLRSYSMNAYIDTGLPGSALTDSYKIYRINQVRYASNTILFAEEPDPISGSSNESLMAAVSQANSDGWIQNPPSVANSTGTWGNIVASWHRGGSNFTFVDGHAEYWKFTDQRTINYLKNDPSWPTVPYTTPNNADLARISAAIVTWPRQRPQ